MMMKMIGSATSAVLVAACMVATAIPAGAATSSSGGITVVTPASVTTYNGARAVIKPAVTVQSGTNKAVTASRITATWVGTRSLRAPG